jgi:hypothetical protein
LIGGTMASAVFRAKLHIGYLAAIVAASNAGGSGSVVGDTTTTMMWIDGVSPLVVAEAVIPAVVALVIFGIPAALQQHRHSPIVRDAQAGAHIDWAAGRGRGGAVAAIGTNVVVNMRWPTHAGAFPFIGAAVWVTLLLTASLRRPDYTLFPYATRSSVFLLSLMLTASLMPVHELPAASWQHGRAGLRLAVFDNVRQRPTLKQAARLGHAGLRCRLRRLHDLVRFVRRRGPVRGVSRGPIGVRVAARRVARCDRLRGRHSGLHVARRLASKLMI